MAQQRPRALGAAFATVVLMAAALVVMVDEAGQGAHVLLQPKPAARTQGLSWELSADPADDSDDAGMELDYGKESGVGEAMDSAKGDISDIRGMAGKRDFDDDPVRQKLKKIMRAAKKFEAQEAAYYKELDAPAKVNIRVEQGSPGKQGKRGFRGSTGPMGALGEKGPTGVRGFEGPKGSEGLQGPQGGQGATGNRGPTGKKGLTGPGGPMGVRGKRGPNGSQVTCSLILLLTRMCTRTTDTDMETEKEKHRRRHAQTHAQTTHTNTHTHSRTHTHTFTQTHTHTRTDTHAHTCTRIHAHAHTPVKTARTDLCKNVIKLDADSVEGTRLCVEQILLVLTECLRSYEN